QFHMENEKLKAAAIFAKTGRVVFVFELFLGGGSLGYVNSILYFYFLFSSIFALNFGFKVRYTFLEFVAFWSIIFADICGKCWLILYIHMSLSSILSVHMIIETIFELYALGRVRVRVLGFGFWILGFGLGL